MDAKKQTVVGKDALGVLKDVDEVVAARGKKVVRYHLKKDKPSDDNLRAIMLGPTGNLRAPTFRVGRTLIIGFDEATYKDVLK